MRFLHLPFLVTLWSKCREVFPNTSKEERISIVKSIGYSKFKTVSTKHILADEVGRLKALVTSDTQVEEAIQAINVWMQAASEHKLLIQTCEMRKDMVPLMEYMAS
jgi:hypothetical protein